MTQWKLKCSSWYFLLKNPYTFFLLDIKYIVIFFFLKLQRRGFHIENPLWYIKPLWDITLALTIFLCLTSSVLFADYGLLTLHFNCLLHKQYLFFYYLIIFFFFPIAFSSSRITRFEFSWLCAVWHQWCQQSLFADSHLAGLKYGHRKIGGISFEQLCEGLDIS